MQEAHKITNDINDIKALIYEYHGNIAQISQKLGLARFTVYNYLKSEPDLKKYLDECRSYNNETILDFAEHVFHYNLINYKNNPGLAQRAAEKVVERKGASRGWLGDTSGQNPINDKDLELSHENMILRDENRKLRAENADITQAG